MLVESVHLTNFKRFSDLLLTAVTPDGKPGRLVLVIGANGAGKSSVFDAFQLIQPKDRKLPSILFDYYVKEGTKNASIHLKMTDGGKEKSEVTCKLGNQVAYPNFFNFNKTTEINRIFYGRSAQRTKSKIPEIRYYDPDKMAANQDGARTFIDRDNRFNNDIYQLTFEATQILSQYLSGEEIKKDFIENFVEPINRSLQNILGSSENTSIRLVDIRPPFENRPPQWFFKKGGHKIGYDLLSNGEKEVFGQLINWAFRRKEYPESIFFIDEMDAHLNTSVQKALLKEIVEQWLPPNAQLWVATHSLGFIEYAQESPDAVVLDLVNLDFDRHQIVYPSPKGNLEVYEIAIPKSTLDILLRDKKIVVCENKNDDLYNLLGLPDCIFVGVANNHAVFTEIKNNPTRLGLRDRDFISENERSLIREKYPNIRILEYYCFENYLYHPENLAELNRTDLDLEAYVEDLRAQKRIAYEEILLDLKNIRKSYQELGKAGLDLSDKILKDHLNEILDHLKSDDPEHFLRYFNMRDHFKKDILAPLNLSKKTLVSTNWFKSKITQVIQ